MTGNELAKAIKAAHGKIYVPVFAVNSVSYVYAEKTDLVEWARGLGEIETFMRIDIDGGAWMLVRDE